MTQTTTTVLEPTRRSSVRYRLVLGRLLLIPIILLIVFSQPIYAEDSVVVHGLEILGFLFLVASTIGRIWTAGYISGRKNSELVQDGPYSITRNPLYFFSFLGFVGAGLMMKSAVVAAALVGFFFLMHWATIIMEERKLRDLFGGEFDTYCQSTPRFFPKLSNFRNPSELTIDPHVFSKAVLDSSLILLVVGVAECIQWAHDAGVVPAIMRLP